MTIRSINQHINSGTVPQTNPISQNYPPKRTILVLAASPTDMPRLRLNKEISEIDEGLRLGDKRDSFNLEQSLAARTKDIRRALLRHKPQIVHFCGHGETDGIFLENDSGQKQLVPINALASLFQIFADEGVQCVVLNACCSEVQAEEISKHINFVVGMSRAIGDNAAIQFAVGFYDALGAGWSYDKAYELGCNAIALEGIPEELTPVLKKKPS
ncbi:MAG: CHAT domain-containing protein [Xenococcaceae cyanobacterium]